LRSSTPSARLVSFLATDGMRLPGLLYEPSRPTRHVAIYLHGNGDASVFSSRRTNLLASHLSRSGVAFFPFDNRGAHLIKTLTRVTPSGSESVDQGMTYERIADCVADIDGAVRFLKSLGYRRFSLIGHSTGANKICLYDQKRKRNVVSSYVLLAPGDDVGIYLDQLGLPRFLRTLLRCRREIERGRENQLADRRLSPFPISWGSLYDTINPEGDYNVFPFLEAMGKPLSGKPLFKSFASISKPCLTVMGASDEFCFGNAEACLELMKHAAAARPRSEFRLISGADHGFHGKERALGKLLVEWLASA